MYSSLGTVEFLTRAEDRLDVLNTLSQKSRSRDELEKTTDRSRSTISRMLSDFEMREWVVHRDGRYSLTAAGRYVASELDQMLDRIGTLDEVRFLARSSSRVEVLAAMAESPQARYELRELSGASRVTVNRILDDLADRGWLNHDDGVYEATTKGRVVAEEFTRVLTNLQTLERLEEHVNWIELDQFDFELFELQNANVITPTWDDFSAYTSTLVDLVYESTAIRAIGTGLHREFLQALGDATINADLSLDLIYAPEVIDAIESDPDLSRLARDLTDTDKGAIYRYVGEKPLMMLLIHETEDPADDVALLCGQHEEGAPPGTVETTNPRVRSWAESYFESVLEDSEPIDEASNTPEQAETA